MSIIPSTFQAALAFAEKNGYFLIFILMVIEGPTITAAAAFASSLGYFNVFTILSLSILADLVADTMYFYIGASGLKKVLKKYFNKSNSRKQTLASIEKHLKTHPLKTIVAIKLTPFAVPGLVALGSSKMPFRKFIFGCAIMILPSAAAFTSIGYFLGYAFEKYSIYVGFGKGVVLIGVLLLLLMSVLIKKSYSRIGKRIERI